MNSLKLFVGAAAIAITTTSAFADASSKSDVNVYNFDPRAPIAVAPVAAAPVTNMITSRYVPQLPTGLVATTQRFADTTPVWPSNPIGMRPDSGQMGSDR